MPSRRGGRTETRAAVIDLSVTSIMGVMSGIGTVTIPDTGARTTDTTSALVVPRRSWRTLQGQVSIHL